MDAAGLNLRRSPIISDSFDSFKREIPEVASPPADTRQNNRVERYQPSSSSFSMVTQQPHSLCSTEVM